MIRRYECRYKILILLWGVKIEKTLLFEIPLQQVCAFSVEILN